MEVKSMQKFKSIFCNLHYNWHKRLFKNKCFEIEAYSGLINLSNKLLISFWSREIAFAFVLFYALLKFEIRITWKTDHAGINLWLGLLGFEVGLHFYDTRHWDIKNNRWERYDEQGNLISE